ncbi:uncharacterized protein LOC116337620 [Contarinia nasturtii]|uniref:uncharacterized protein LOC116337620 n=1 Tax=Contarinia nasturtii TaxID=265458 RepID=UPI0012D43318|nr:uncharacterized protein LOC116337620 [Contarinia nasturtii]XP_031618159.1 uncharacterized protein LOC116337620 [Contarinia nasturtii]
MVNQLKCLKAGGLVLGIIGTVVALINAFWAIAWYEHLPIVEANFILHSFLGEAPDHIVRLFYVTVSLFDMLAAALLIAGILMKKKYFLLPWIISSMLEIVITSIELSPHLIPSVVIVGIFGGVLYIWFSIVTLYKEMKAEEQANSGVQMSYVEENPSQLPPYSVLTIDK